MPLEYRVPYGLEGTLLHITSGDGQNCDLLGQWHYSLSSYSSCLRVTMAWPGYATKVGTKDANEQLGPHTLFQEGSQEVQDYRTGHIESLRQAQTKTKT